MYLDYGNMISSEKGNPCVLVLDDSSSILEVLKKELCGEFDVVTCSKTDDFFRLLEEHHPEVVLLDMVMPDENGLEICKKVKSMGEFQSTPVIFLTALEDTFNEELGFQAGAVDYIRKPINIPILKARVRTHAELKQMRDYLEDLGYHDSLTGIKNKRAFIEEFRIAWIKALRTKNPVSLLIMDIDYFKSYNDNYGHIKGDDCLKSVAVAIEKHLDHKYQFFRFGGEEFIILAVDTNEENARNLAEVVKKTIENLNLPHEKSGISSKVTLSIGVVTTIARSRMVPENLLEAADKALYSAKEKGRNCIVTSLLS